MGNCVNKTLDEKGQTQTHILDYPIYKKVQKLAELSYLKVRELRKK